MERDLKGHRSDQGIQAAVLLRKTIFEKRICVARGTPPVRFLECGQLYPCFTGEQSAIFVTFGGESIVDVKCSHESLVGISPGFNCIDGVSVPGSIAGAGHDPSAGFWGADFVWNDRDIAFSTAVEPREAIADDTRMIRILAGMRSKSSPVLLVTL